MPRALPWLLAVLVCVAGPTGAAQRNTGAAAKRTERPGWLPRTDTTSTGVDQAMTAAERAIVEARFAAYERLFATPDSLARPQGFVVWHNVGGGVRDGLDAVPRFGYAIFVGPVKREDTPVLSALENPAARHVWTVANGPPTFADADGDIYAERPKRAAQSEMPPTAVVYDGLQFDKPTRARLNTASVLLTANGELPWSDVPRERVLRILIADAERVFKVAEEQAAETSYQQWLREAPRRQKDREEILVGIAFVDKTQVPHVRENLERADREAGESYRKSEAAEREVATRSLDFAKARLTAVRAQFAAMSPAERAMPAWIQLEMTGANAGTYAFASPGTPGFEHLIADKSGYYRFTGSRVQLRALLLSFRIKEVAREEQLDPPVIDSYKAFDWMAAARLLTPAAKR